MQRASVTAVACVDFGPQEFRTRLEEHGPQIEHGSRGQGRAATPPCRDPLYWSPLIPAFLQRPNGGTSYSATRPLARSSLSACSLFFSRSRLIPRRTSAALVNWISSYWTPCT